MKVVVVGAGKTVNRSARSLAVGNNKQKVWSFRRNCETDEIRSAVPLS
jgi:hypothetical protein